jgi:tight adherence protein C
MSDLLLPLGLAGVFLSVALIAVAVELSHVERRRAVQMLKEQVVKPPVSLRQEDLSRPFAERALIPLVSWLRTAGTVLTPMGLRRRITVRLAMVGNPEGWDAEKVAAIKIVAGGGGAALAVAASVLLSLAGLQRIALVVVLAVTGFLLPHVVLSLKVRSRQEAIRRALPDVLDLLTITVEAGLSLDAALAQVVRNSEGPLTLEIARMLQEVQLGVSRVDALRQLAARTDVEELNSFVLAMVQAEEFGVSTMKVLRAQAKQMRLKRRQRAELKSMQVPVKIVFPLIFCIMPALFVVIVGPAAIRVINSLFRLV